MLLSLSAHSRGFAVTFDWAGAARSARLGSDDAWSEPAATAAEHCRQAAASTTSSVRRAGRGPELRGVEAIAASVLLLASAAVFGLDQGCSAVLPDDVGQLS